MPSPSPYRGGRAANAAVTTPERISVTPLDRPGVNPPDGWTTGTVRANGIDVHYYRAGGGPPVVLAHGFTDNGQCWAPLAPGLVGDYDLVMYDARGHGRSDAPPTGYGIGDRVADLVGVVDALDLTDPVLVGHSMGGTTVASVAAAHPDLPRGVVLEDPAGMLDGTTESGSAAGARDHREDVRRWNERSVDDLAADFADRGPDLARRLAVARTECDPRIANVVREGFPDPRGVFPDVDCRTLILRADGDPARRAADLDVADSLPDGRLVHVPGAGHCVFRDEYDAAYAELRTFLRRL